jgi:hypothetical protein
MSLNAGDSPSQHSKLCSAYVFSGALLVFWNDSVDSLEIIRIQGWREGYLGKGLTRVAARLSLLGQVG